MEQKEIKQYLIETRDGEFIIDIDSSWKITFGPVAIGGNRNHGDSGSMALRIYESDTKQRAIFTGVKGFRDMSIPIKKKIIKTIGEDKYEYDSKGNKSLVEKANKEEVWEAV